MGRNNLGICFVLAALLISYSKADFVKTSGTKFVNNNKPFYFNGFNAYWLMVIASEPSNRNKVTDVLFQASRYKMNVARTWAFSDGNFNGALQTSPGKYNEQVFQGLDFVVAEAKKRGIYLILSLVNNYDDFGGKKQYVQWARDQGRNLPNDDAFFTDPVVKGFYKNHIKTVLTRVNTITRIAYKDDPTILAWELINEPRCQSDLSGKAIQGWVAEMSGYLKSIDSNHLLEIGLEGFYGQSTPDKTRFNPGFQIGTDFIANNRVAGVDFATIHVYPDLWLPQSNNMVQAQFAMQWIQAHIGDSQSVLAKPLLIAEFGKSSKSANYTVGARDGYFSDIFNNVIVCARRGGPCGGTIFWQLMSQGMENFADGYEVILQQSPSTARVINRQSRRISSLNNGR